MELFPTKLPASKIPRTVLSCSSESFLRQKIECRYHFKDVKAQKIVLMKSFPKYYRCLDINFDFKRGPALSKIKQVKTIEHFRYISRENESFDRREQGILKPIRNLLQTKRKSINSPNVIYLPDVLYPDGLVSRMHISRFFPRIRQLSTCIFAKTFYQGEFTGVSSRLSEKQMLKHYQYFWNALTYLQSLTLVH